MVTQKALTEIVRDYHEQMKDFSETLIHINTNITDLNAHSHQMREDLNSVEKELKSLKDSENNRGKFDMVEFMSKDLPKYILLAIMGAILVALGLNW